MDVQERILRKVKDLGKKAGNNVCAECPERHPNWVSMLKPAKRGGEPLAAFVCNGCYMHHYLLGPKLCEVKGLTMATGCKLRTTVCLGYCVQMFICACERAVSKLLLHVG